MALEVSDLERLAASSEEGSTIGELARVALRLARRVARTRFRRTPIGSGVGEYTPLWHGMDVLADVAADLGRRNDPRAPALHALLAALDPEPVESEGKRGWWTDCIHCNTPLFSTDADHFAVCEGCAKDSVELTWSPGRDASKRLQAACVWFPGLLSIRVLRTDAAAVARHLRNLADYLEAPQ